MSPSFSSLKASFSKSKSSSISKHVQHKGEICHEEYHQDNAVQNVLPVVIIPGIMSSGLEVIKSSVNDKHIGERVWLNPIALGFGKLYLKGKSGAFTLGESSKKLTTKKKKKKKKHFFGLAKKNEEDDEDDESDSDSDSDSHDSDTTYEEGDGDDDNEDNINVADDIKKNIVDIGKQLKEAVTIEKKKTEDEDDEKEKVEFEKEKEVLNCKSTWLQHLTLSSDMYTERVGNEIRPISGLDGVDFLTDIATIKVGASYVFGPLVDMLIKETSGKYIKGINIDAVPYDWRLPPCILEERDAYFTNTMERIEKMCNDNNSTPVVLLCHSMGCKTGHYLLNFALHKPNKGRDWIDKYIHTYIPVGAPHIGVPSVIGSSFAASINPLLDPMLSKEERLMFARSLGSACWLTPTILPSIERNAPPSIMYKREGTLIIEIISSNEGEDAEPIGDLRQLVTNKHGTRKVKPFKIGIEYGSNNNTDSKNKKKKRRKLKSGVAIPVPTPLNKFDDTNSGTICTEKQYFTVPASKFVFPTPPNILVKGDHDGCDGLNDTYIRYTVYEQGDMMASDSEPMHPLAKGGQIIIDRNYRFRQFWNYVATNHSKGRIYKTNIGMSEPITFSYSSENINNKIGNNNNVIDVKKLVNAGNKGIEIIVPVISRTDMTLIGLQPKQDYRSIDIKVRVTWKPPLYSGSSDNNNVHDNSSCDNNNKKKNDDDDVTNPIAMLPSESTQLADESSLFVPIPEIKSTKKKDEDVEYIPLSGSTMLRAEDLQDTFIKLTKEKYCDDSLGPRTISSYDRPPVNHTFAIYGINVDTEVSKVCRKVSSYIACDTVTELVRPQYKVDKHTTLLAPLSNDDNDDNGVDGEAGTNIYKLEQGTLYEHSKTPQVDLRTGEKIYCSGDGSVPYWSLQQSQEWAKKSIEENSNDTIEIKEIDGAEHRAILSDERFHKMLLNFLTLTTNLW